MELDPATAAYQKHGYNERPVEATLGPHRFRIPANYFRDQIGPDFQGGWELMVQWPDLEPLPPGKRSGQAMETFDKQITISPNYVDRVPIETLLNTYASPNASPGELEYDDPRNRLDLLVAQPEQDGLTPYVVNSDLLLDYARRFQARMGVPMSTSRRSYKDWFIRRDAGGALQTLIRCDHLPEQGEETSPVCNHDIVIPELQIAVGISYRRAYLPEWQRIETKARELLDQFRVDR